MGNVLQAIKLGFEWDLKQRGETSSFPPKYLVHPHTESLFYIRASSALYIPRPTYKLNYFAFLCATAATTYKSGETHH